MLQVVFSGNFFNESISGGEGDKKGWMSILGGGTGGGESEWEEWTIRITLRHADHFSTEEDRLRFNQVLAKNLQGCLLYISNMSLEYREHLPRRGMGEGKVAIPASPTFKILTSQVTGHGGGTESWSAVLKKIIADTASLNYR